MTSFSFGKLSEMLARLRQRRALRLRRETVIVWGVVLLGMFTLFLLLWDAVLFLTTVAGERAVSQPTKVTTPLSTQEIDEVIQLLDERKAEFNELLAQ